MTSEFCQKGVWRWFGRTPPSAGNYPALRTSTRTCGTPYLSFRFVSWPGGYRAAAYYIDWAIYGRAYFPSDIPASHLTHLHYAFANVNNTTGEVFLTDLFADEQKLFPEDVNATGTNLYGCLGQIFKLKKANRNLKTLLSIGSWSYRHNFPSAVATETSRATFAKTAVGLLKDYGFDGIDIDWEYPEGKANAANFVKLLHAIRNELDSCASNIEGKPYFILTGAFAAGPQHYKWLQFAEIDKYLDYWVLMAYDYTGSTSNFTGYMDNLYPSETDAKRITPYNTEQAVDDYIAGGATPDKITLGMPLYGRAFAHTMGLGKPFNGTGPGSWEDGVWDYKVLPLANSTITEDTQVGGAYCYNSMPGNRTLVSYDTPNIALQKSKYLQSKGLGGATWWETSGDLPCTNPSSLIDVVVNDMGGVNGLGLQKIPNWLTYPDSKFENSRNMMGNESLGGACPFK